MASILKFLSGLTAGFNLSEEGAIALTIGIIIVGIVLAFAIFRILKKIAGKTIAVIALIIVLSLSGIFSLSSFGNFAQKIGMVKESSVGEGLEIDGQAFVNWINRKQPTKEEGAGTWVPDKESQTDADWNEQENVDNF